MPKNKKCNSRDYNIGMARESLESTGEKGAKLYSNFNAVVGAVALGASVLLPPLAAGAAVAYGAFNLVQAGGGEVARRHFEKKRKKKKQK